MCDISLKEAYCSEVQRALSSIPQECVKNPLNNLSGKLHWRMNVDKKMVLFGLCTVSSFSFLEGGARPFYSLLDRGYIISGSWGLFLYSPCNFSGPESCFVCAVFAFKIKVLIILKTIQ